MADREKVIRALECCILRDPDDHARCSKCSYGGNCVNRLKMDALELLKEQQSAYERGKRDGVSQYLREREDDEEYEY